MIHLLFFKGYTIFLLMILDSLILNFDFIFGFHL